MVLRGDFASAEKQQKKWFSFPIEKLAYQNWMKETESAIFADKNMIFFETPSSRNSVRCFNRIRSVEKINRSRFVFEAVPITLYEREEFRLLGLRGRLGGNQAINQRGKIRGSFKTT